MGIKAFNQSGPSFINKFGRAANGDSTGLDAVNGPPPAAVTAMSATGGVISDYTEPGGNIYRAHVFTSTGTFTVTELGENSPTADAVEYLVIAGGGGGGDEGSQRGGGGGAGGYRTNVPAPIGPGNHTTTAPFPVATGSYNIIIGGGGAGGDGSQGSDGGDSQLGPPSLAERIISNGGGGGGRGSHDSPPANEGRPGGSGGGGGSTASPSATEPGGSTTAVTTPSPWPGPSTQGFAGGTGQHASGSWAAGGGGGGAGEAGKSPGTNPNTNSSHGGDGLSNLIAGPQNTGVGVANPAAPGRWFAGGGAGIHFSPGTGNGEAGGGGSTSYPGNGDRGVDGTGGGGASGAMGGQGGSGIIIVRYQIGSVSDAKATGGNISFHGGKTIHTFLSSGAFVVDSSAIPSAEVVVVAGGGGGGGYAGQGWGASGGGGAGGMLVHPGRPFAAGTTYPIVIGSGGM